MVESSYFCYTIYDLIFAPVERENYARKMPGVYTGTILYKAKKICFAREGIELI